MTRREGGRKAGIPMRKLWQHNLSSRALQITPCERQALQRLADGHTTEDVAADLGLSVLDTEALLEGLFAAIGAATQAEAIAAAHRRGLLGYERSGATANH
jgi:DNA-binding CsgD family transcriptional regulator